MAKGIRLLITLNFWHIWKHRNARIFDGARPDCEALTEPILNLASLWQLAEAKNLRKLPLYAQPTEAMQP
ncbi:hypothetical protein BRADI_2g51135v3 [Brachypodium distachyon]|uniref:Uncharacterized protein n=1 Tax=Brachypodium distachyon TaxID=15368 RepID=A0A2K2DF69_BRADI|nr:hypothetical protein BRADI_2g51135v3 [Brachypodium distachyon]